ncbi:MAG: hypothetical protein AAFW84_24560 [Cyanobacteria bacterium J06635_15]
MSILPSPQPNGYSNSEEIKADLRIDGDTLLELLYGEEDEAAGITPAEIRVLVRKLRILMGFLLDEDEINKVDKLRIDCVAANSLYNEETRKSRIEFFESVIEIASKLKKLN